MKTRTGLKRSMANVVVVVVTLGLLGAWRFPADQAKGENKVPEGISPANSESLQPSIVEVDQPKLPTPRPLRIEGASEANLRATVTGPEFHAPELFQGFEDYYQPRLKRLREDYYLDKVVEGDANEFRQILKLRHWVHSRWPIDNDQNFSGDAFAILEKAKTGAGFHCAHSMTVQQAVLSAMGYVARYVLVDRNHEDLGRSVHHGVNEVWSNDYAKWVLLDAKYDIHFERDGVPLSALELHEAVRADGGRGIVMVQGVERHVVPMGDPQPHEASIRSYWWVCYPQRQNPFTQPHFAARERLVIFDNAAFRSSTWQRDQGAGLAPHWAYAAGAFVPTLDRTQIEWTPGVVELRARQTATAELEVQIRSATPNLQAYVVRFNGGQPQTVTEGRVQWELHDGENSLEVRSRNLFGVLGPSLLAAVSRQPAAGSPQTGEKVSDEPRSVGLAAKYPGDVGLAHDARVLFAEDFESGTLAELTKRWTETSNKDGKVLALSPDAPPGSVGKRSLQMTATLGENSGGHLYQRLPRGVEKLHARFYVKFAEDAGYEHHFVSLGGYNPPTNWPQGGAGERPRGDDRIYIGIEPHGHYGRVPPPGGWSFYSYWPEMKISADGKYWGNAMSTETPLAVPRGRWQCVEVMAKLNSAPDKADGELALWLDGRKAMHIAQGTPRGQWSGMGFQLPPQGGEPFEGFRWRTNDASS